MSIYMNLYPNVTHRRLYRLWLAVFI